MSDTPRPALSEDEAVLRAKYLDFCSARVAELFLSLPPDEVFVLADESGLHQPSGTEAPFDTLVRGAALKLAERSGLPSFEDWAEAYEADPDLFEADLMGLWRSDAPAGPPAPEEPASSDDTQDGTT